MAKIGLKHIVAAKATDTGSAIAYSEGMVLAKAVTANVAITTNDVKLYADDAIAESDKSFSSGTITAGIDDFISAAKVLLLGYVEGSEVDAVTGEKELTTAGAESNEVGFGFYAKGKKDGTNYWRAIWLVKVKFGEPGEEFTTKGESVEFATPEIEGTIMTASWDGTYWKEEARFSTEDAAATWLNTKAGIGSGTTGNASALAMSAGTLTPTFAAGTYNYTADVATTASTITATFAAGTAKLYVDGAYVEDLTSTEASSSIAFVDGVAKLIEIVIKEAGKTAVTYSVMALYTS
jgi:phi13 family phage major tail protein